MRPGPTAVVESGQIAAKLTAAFVPRNDVIFAYLFGSHAGGSPTPRSDVDVAVWLREPYDRSRLSPYLDLVGVVTSALGRQDVDVVVLNEAPLRLAFQVLGGRLVADRDESVRVNAEASILSRYHDRLPYFRRHIEHAGKMLAERGFS